MSEKTFEIEASWTFILDETKDHEWIEEEIYSSPMIGEGIEADGIEHYEMEDDEGRTHVSISHVAEITLEGDQEDVECLIYENPQLLPGHFSVSEYYLTSLSVEMI
jgi:hypothetical protein